MIAMEMHLHGAKELHARLRSLKTKAARKVARGATTAGARVLAKSVKASAVFGRYSRGVMKKSITVKVKQYSASGIFIGIAGPNKRTYMVTRTFPSGKEVKVEAIPERYVHLLELGHRIVVGGTLSRSLSRGGIVFSKLTGKRLGVRKTTRRSEEQKRVEGRQALQTRRKSGHLIIATSEQSKRTGAGNVVGKVQPNPFLARGARLGRNYATRVFMANMKAGIDRAWSQTS